MQWRGLVLIEQSRTLQHGTLTREFPTANTEMNIGGCCTGLRPQLNADKLQKLLQLLRFLPPRGNLDEMPEFEEILEDVKTFLKDVDNFLSNTLKKEKLKKDTNTQKEALLNELNELQSKLPEKIEKDEYTGPAAQSTDEAFIMVHHDERNPDQSIDDDSIYDDTADLDHMNTTVSSSDPDQTTRTDVAEQDDNGNWNEGNDDSRSVNWDEPYGDMKIAPVAASSLDTPIKMGWLEKKRKEGQIGLPGWQTRYCVIKANVLYYYKKETDKKQCNCIILTGYEGRRGTKQKKNQFFFDLVCPAKRSFTFIAKTESEMAEWIEAIKKASTAPPDVTLTERVPTAGTVSNASASSRENLLDNQEMETNMNTTADTDDFYDDTAAQESSLEAQSSMDQESSQDFGETYEVVETTNTGSSGQDGDFETAEDDEIYETMENNDVPSPMIQARLPTLSNQDARKPLPATPDTTPSPRLPTNVPTRVQQPLPPAPNPTMPNPTIPTSLTSMRASMSINNNGEEKEPWEEDYDNIYIGKWDCKPEDKDELAFNRGDLLHIISREYDMHNWWVAEKSNKVGLVPTKYLMKAYIM